jgi:hypothetical protein
MAGRLVLTGWLTLTLSAGAVVQAPVASTAPPVPLLPASGWLIISGPIHDAEACALTRAYSLQTGAAFVHDGCSGRASAGTLAGASVPGVAAALMARRDGPWTPGPRPATHIWRLVQEDAHVSVIGDLPWPPPDSPDGDDPALRRLREAEAQLAPGCAPPLPPPSVALAAALPRMVNAVSADASQALTVRYRAARERWSRLPACASP